MSRPRAGPFLVVPHVAVVLAAAANVVAYLLCCAAGGTPAISPPVLVAAGALTRNALQPGETWRLLSAGFLHADPVHLLANLLSLLIAGPTLERRLGTTAFVLVYAASLAGAGATSVALHPEPLIGLGASGAIFGLMGALLALWGLGDAGIPPSFLRVNFALNAALASRHSRIDWAAHAGGHVIGMTAVALLDAASRANALWLRWKFPEFVAANAVLLVAAGCAALWLRPPLAPPSVDPSLAAAGCGAAAASVFVKALDLLLSVRHGLAAVVLMLAALLCPNVAWTPAAAASLAGLATLTVLARPLSRGLADVGFLGATYVGNRRRERGLVRPTCHTRV